VVELQQDEAGIGLMPKKIKGVLNKQRIPLLIWGATFVFSIFVVPIILESAPVQTLVSGNVTLQNFVEVTKQPMWYVFAPLAGFVIFAWVWLWIQAGKPANSNLATKADIAQNTRILILIAKKLGVSEDEIASAIQRKPAKAKGKK
jgi:hypothetical protein